MIKRTIERIRNIPNGQKYRYLLLIAACILFLAPFAVLPQLANNPDLCGKVCIRRFYLYFPGMNLTDLGQQMSLAIIGVFILLGILLVTFFYGRMWCSYVCPVGGFPELLSRTMNDKWKIEYRALPQIPIRYGYFGVYLLLMPAIGISACTLCNFITVPRIFEVLSGGIAGLAFLLSAVGLVNVGLLFLLGIFANKGRAYCQFLCPVGAIDALVNRLGAKLRFTRRIRVERSRCTGCNICARNCMCGAIKMVDRVAVVDQLSCMSCHECVDVCDWGAIDWIADPAQKEPKRKKKGIDFHPQPQWTAIHIHKPEDKGKKAPKWRRVAILGLLLAISLAGFTQVQAAERYPDEDGCLSCHALKGLDYIDESGVQRSASIDVSHYMSSLHGSVPCRDCHRKVRFYPHKVENGEVDCAASCHVEEPSKGKPYTHKAVVKEFTDSAHGTGWSKGFTGGNRLKEVETEQNPSCRTCHSNTLYIDVAKLDGFKEAFSHTETECGSCHQGEVWLNQFGGHILRRFLGGRWSKQEQNEVCHRCHDDRERMALVELKEEGRDQKIPVPVRWQLASQSYAMTLHARLIRTEVDEGASCNDCHAPEGTGHNIRRKKDPASATHEDKLAKTCAQSQCHAYASHRLNAGFVRTDMHDLDLVPLSDVAMKLDVERLRSPWLGVALLIAPVLVFMLVGRIRWWLVAEKKKGVDFSVIGGDSFQEKMLGRKAKTKKNKVRSKGGVPAAGSEKSDA